MALPLPNPIVFDLSVRDKKEVRAAYVFAEMGRLGNVAPALVMFSAILQTIGPSVRLFRWHGNDPGEWVLLVVALTLVAAIGTFAFLRSRAATMFDTPEFATVVSFERSGLSIERTNRSGTRTTRKLPFSRIRKVRLLTDAVVFASHWRPLLIVPRTALPDDGVELMAFLDDRLTGKAMLLRTSSSRTTIVNSASTQ